MKQANIHSVMRSCCCSFSYPLNKDEALNKNAFMATNISSPYSAAHTPSLHNATHTPSPRSIAHTPSPRNVFMRGIKSFLFRPISRIKTLRDDEAGVRNDEGYVLRGDGVRVSGFTLIELLVVVLIIGVLSAIAIPMYQGAVDKSHWSTMLPASKAVKDAEEAFKMTNGEYSDTMEHLDVQMNNSDLTFTLSTPNTLADPNVIRVTNSKLDNVRLASYLDDSPLFAGQLHCEAKNEGSTPNERGQRLCEKLLNGQYLKTTDDGYTRYLLDQSVDASTCKASTGSWSTSKTKCYNTTAERCDALGIGVVAGIDDQCGDENGGKGNYGAETVCLATSSAYIGCAYNTFSNGGECVTAEGSVRGCYQVILDEGGVCKAYPSVTGASLCEGVQINSGGVCIGDARNACIPGNSRTVDGGICVGNQQGTCGPSHANTYINGAICYANYSGACFGPNYWSNEQQAAAYDSTSCCCGSFCPSAVPKCSERGKACDPQYMK